MPADAVNPAVEAARKTISMITIKTLTGSAHFMGDCPLRPYRPHRPLRPQDTHIAQDLTAVNTNKSILLT